MSFEEWYKQEYLFDEETCSAFALSRRNDKKKVWTACKREVLKIIHQYHNTSAFPYIKEKIEKEI